MNQENEKLEEKVQKEATSQTLNKKGSIGGKILKTTAVVAATPFVFIATAAAGTYGLGVLTYKKIVKPVTKRVWDHFYPPKLGKYLATFTIAGLIYGTTHCGEVKKAGEDVINAIGLEWESKKHVQRIEHEYDNQQLALKKQITELSQGKHELKQEYNKKDQEAQILKKQVNSVKQTNQLLRTQNSGLESTIKANKSTITAKEKYITKLKSGISATPSTDSARIYNDTEATSEIIRDKTFSSKKKLKKEVTYKTYKSRTNTLPSTLNTLEDQLSSNFSYVIYVDKQNNMLSLYESGSSLHLITSYKCSTGKNTGSKTRSGDSATPEGAFKFTYSNFSSNLSDLYGEGILGIGSSYQGIVLCGADYSDRIRAIEQGRPITNGGIIVQNHDLLNLYSEIKNDLGKTVIIVEHLSRPLRK